MAQKTKVKELVGRGLHSYHTKALQQMDRIEKKNKEQNHKISILSNELDNDYLTKTEEGSVISLEHSKEGMVYLDELQGNTLVNYCTDGSKEMTLNGDIDVEGTFVTTTEGVDNGKVDVMCKGNTLVNLVNRYSYNANKYSHVCFFKSGMLKPSTKYSAIITNLSNENMKLYWNEGIFSYVEITIPANSTKVFTHTTKAEMNIDEQSTLFKNTITHTQAIQFKVIFLEGDWTNKELPTSYFEGMKSVGQDDMNGHKIEISSQNKNLLLPTARDKKIPIFLKKGTTLTLSTKDNAISNGGNIMMYDVNGEVVWFAIDTGQTSVTRTLPRDIYYMKDALSYNVNYELKYQLEISNTKTSYVEPKQNKKEILINEPLRGLPNGVKDKIVKIGGKWYIERNCKVATVDDLNVSVGYRFDDYNTCSIVANLKTSNALINRSNPTMICNTIPHYIKHNYGAYTEYNYISLWADNTAFFVCQIRGLSSVEEYYDYFRNNNCLFLYPLAKPTYEEIIDMELTTYLDITHISNNSIIPCNMVVKNSGYNAIIKPSTLYTVALDTNKSGTIGLNLGGAKVTTTNNVATVTTPATLTDDSLRLYGKGIKGSKVRLLEGDKTNWIPSHFEGMKSSFEDKLQDDGSYKMEISSNNKNLIDFSKHISKNGQVNYEIDRDNSNIIASSNENGTWQNIGIAINVKNEKTYTLSYESIEYQSTNGITVDNNAHVNIYEGKPNRRIANVKYNTKNTTFTIPKDVNVKDLRIRIHITQGTSDSATIKIKGLMLTESTKKLDFAPPTSNKIQFSSIEPLRSVGTARDRFVFIDNKLKIERNVGSYIINGTEQWYYALDPAYVNHNNIYFRTRNLVNDKKTLGAVRNDKLPNYIDDILWSSDRMGFGTNDQYFVNGFCVRLPRRIIGNGTRAEMERNCKEWLSNNNLNVVYALEEPTYEEIPFELQKIILEGYENGTIFFDTNIPPTSTVTYAGETPIVKATRLNKTEVLNNTNDINDNIIPYLMDMDYRVVCLQLATEEIEGGVSMARLFGGAYEMLKRDILSKRLSRQEYGYRLADYFNAGKLTEEQVRELEDLR